MIFHEKSAAVLLSGGMDSVTLAYHLKDLGVTNLHCLAFNYGQRHKKELSFASRIAGRLSANFRIVDLSNLQEMLSGSALTSEDMPVPEGHYAAENMKLTVVPNRNMIMLAIATGYAISRKLELVATAVHAGDHAVYPDCRPEFINSLERTIFLGNEGFGPPRLCTPFINKTKAQIAIEGDLLQVPWALTWSCYKGLDYHCGKCGTCVERKEAFELSGVQDPTTYAP